MNKNSLILAQVKSIRGIPRMLIEGKQVVPNILMPIRGPQPEVYRSEIARAARYGLPLVSVCPGVSVKETVDEVLSCSPNAYIILRICFPIDMRTLGCEGNNYVNQFGEEMSAISYASDKWYNYTKNCIKNIIDQVAEYSVASSHVIGYHIGAADSGEWLGPFFWNGYIDSSPVNQRSFADFLLKRYGTDEALQIAWGNTNVSLQDDNVPNELPGSGCIEMFHNYSAFEERFIDSIKYRKQIDYFEYYNGLAAKRLMGIAAYVKELTEHRSLTMFFYGYHTEARLPHSGQYALHKVLKSPDVDIICAPVSYDDRNEGGKGPSMGPIQGIEAFGKLWLDESDYRSPVRKAQGDSEVAGGLETGGCCKSVEGLLEVVKRQIGKCMVFGGSTWWFDMVGRGWYDFDEFWETNKQLSEWYTAYANIQEWVSPDIAFITDEKARFIEGDPWFGGEAMLKMREPLYTCGLSCGWFLLQNLLEGHLKNTRLVVLLQPWRLDSKTVDKLVPLLNGKTVVLMGGSGLTECSDFARLCGIKIKKAIKGTAKINLIEGVIPSLFGSIDGPNEIERYTTTEGTVLGMYADGVPAVSLSKDKKGIFCGGSVLTSAQLRALGQYAGGHVFTSENDVVFADSGLVVIHSRSSGLKKLNFPQICDIYDACQNKWYCSTNCIHVMVKNQTSRLFFYGDKNVLNQVGIG